jgi:hypothetical protein
MGVSAAAVEWAGGLRSYAADWRFPTGTRGSAKHEQAYGADQDATNPEVPGMKKVISVRPSINDLIDVLATTTIPSAALQTIKSAAGSGLSRTFDDPGPPAELAPLVSLGILARSEPETGRLHQKCGRTWIRDRSHRQCCCQFVANFPGRRARKWHSRKVSAAGVVERLSGGPGELESLAELAEREQPSVEGGVARRRLHDEPGDERVQDFRPNGCYDQLLPPRLRQGTRRVNRRDASAGQS